MFISAVSSPEVWSLGIICYLLGVYFCYIATEKYEVSTYGDPSYLHVSLVSCFTFCNEKECLPIVYTIM